MISLLTITTLILIVILTRICYLLIYKRIGDDGLFDTDRSFDGNGKGFVKTMVVFGSGGHTSEMLKLMTFVPDHYSPRVYTVANSDKMSLEKITELERSKNNQKYVIEMIPRSRGVRQSWLSSVFTTIVSILYTVPMVIKHRPDMVLSNGPGTCIPVCLVAFVLKVFYVKRIEIVYVESICRVTSMSLSGKILYYFADRMFVQWPNLIKSYPRCLYVGRIV